MSHCKEIKCGQNGNATDTDLRDIQFDGKKKKKKKVYMAYIPTSTWESRCAK